MGVITSAFAVGGWPMWAILATDVLFVALWVIAIIVIVVVRGTWVARAIPVGLALLALLPAIAGAGGYALGVRRTDQALVHVDPAQREAVRAVGHAEAEHNVYFGIGSLCVTLPMALLAVAAGWLPGRQRGLDA